MVDAGHVTITVLAGGRVDALTGHTEMGQGLFTAMRQVVCEETGIPPDNMMSAGTRTRREVRARRGPPAARR